MKGTLALKSRGWPGVLKCFKLTRKSAHTHTLIKMQMMGETLTQVIKPVFERYISLEPNFHFNDSLSHVVISVSLTP